MDSLRALIVDDEPLARRRLKRLLRVLGLEDVYECRSGVQAVAAIQSDPPDLVLLDIQMPGMDGFGVVDAIGVDQMPPTVFVTAYNEHALKAFEVHALDYLLKPVEEGRLQQVLQRVRARRDDRLVLAQRQSLTELLKSLGESGQASRPAAAERYVERLLVTIAGQTRFLRASEIDWIAAEGNYVRLHVGDKSCLIRETMATLEKKLDPRQFLRSHRSTIVNLERIVELHPSFAGNYSMKLSTGVELSLSRNYKLRMQDIIATYQ
jgi:two-component system, LytTR family, response regulator